MHPTLTFDLLRQDYQQRLQAAADERQRATATAARRSRPSEAPGRPPQRPRPALGLTPAPVLVR